MIPTQPELQLMQIVPLTSVAFISSPAGLGIATSPPGLCTARGYNFLTDIYIHVHTYKYLSVMEILPALGSLVPY